MELLYLWLHSYRNSPKELLSTHRNSPISLQNHNNPFKLTYANEVKIIVTGEAFDTDEMDCSSGYLKTGERTCEKFIRTKLGEKINAVFSNYS